MRTEAHARTAVSEPTVARVARSGAREGVASPGPGTAVRVGLDAILAPPALRSGLLVAVDPGETAGVAAWDGVEWMLWQEPGWDAVRRVEDLARWEGRVDDLVAEAFVTNSSTAKKTRQPAAAEQVGALRYVAAASEATRFHVQTASDAKTFGTDEKLRRLGLWVPGQRHARDAARHALLLLARMGRGAAVGLGPEVRG